MESWTSSSSGVGLERAGHCLHVNDEDNIYSPVTLEIVSD